MARREPKIGERLAPREGIVFLVVTKDFKLGSDICRVLHRPPEWNASQAQDPFSTRLALLNEKPRIVIREAGFAEDWELPDVVRDIPVIEVKGKVDPQRLFQTVQQVLAQSATLPPPDAELPVADSDEDPYSPPFAIEMEDLRVLAASDDPKFRALVRNAFIVDYPSVTVFDAADRAEALAIIEREHPRLIVAEKALRESLGEIAEGEYQPIVLAFTKNIAYHAVIPLIHQNIRPKGRDV